VRGKGVVATLCAALVAACGGGGGGGGGGTVPPPPSQSLVFTLAGQPGVNTIYLDAADASTPDRLVLEVRANEVDDLFGVALDLLFPSAFLEWDRGAERKGDLLEEEGVGTTLIVDRDGTGRLIIGYSRLGDDVPGVAGSGLLFTIEFRTTASGQGDLTIERQFAVDGAGVRRYDYAWLAGNLRVVK
jgi:hypothetical protein